MGRTECWNFEQNWFALRTSHFALRTSHFALRSFVRSFVRSLNERRVLCSSSCVRSTEWIDSKLHASNAWSDDVSFHCVLRFALRLLSLRPPGREAQFYMLFAFTDKGTSWIGPLIVGAVSAATGTIRWAIVALAPLMLAGGVLLFFVNVEKGRKQAIRFSKIYDGLDLKHLEEADTTDTDANTDAHSGSERSASKSGNNTISKSEQRDSDNALEESAGLSSSSYSTASKSLMNSGKRSSEE
jgi:hypothetical protein